MIKFSVPPLLRRSGAPSHFQIRFGATGTLYDDVYSCVVSDVTIMTMTMMIMTIRDRCVYEGYLLRLHESPLSSVLPRL